MKTTEILRINKEGWEKTAERYYGRTALPDYGPFALSEDQLQLFGPITGKKVLDRTTKHVICFQQINLSFMR